MRAGLVAAETHHRPFRRFDAAGVVLRSQQFDGAAIGVELHLLQLGRDEEDRAFVHIYYGKGMKTSFNELLLKKGYARVDTAYLPDELRHYLELEKEAREKGLGIWADEK